MKCDCRFQIADCRDLAWRARPGAAGRRLRRGHGVPPGRTGDAGRQPRRGRRRSTARPRRPRPTTPNYKIALQRAMLAASRAHLEQGARVREGRISSRRRSASTRPPSEYDPSNRLASAKVAELDRTIRERIEAARPKPAIAGDARAGPRRVGRADPQPGVARAAEPALQQRQPARHPELHRRRARHQRHLRPRVRRSPRHRQPRRRHARAGAEPDHDDEPAVVQGAERAVDLRLPGHAAEARAVRRAGDPDLLPLARRRDRGAADPQHDHPAAGHRGAAGDHRQQDREHDHRARHHRGGRRSSRRSSSRTTSRAPRS